MDAPGLPSFQFSMQIRPNAGLPCFAPSSDRVDALGEELARLRVRVPRVRQRGLEKRTKRLQALNAVQSDL